MRVETAEKDQPTDVENIEVKPKRKNKRINKVNEITEIREEILMEEDPSKAPEN